MGTGMSLIGTSLARSKRSTTDSLHKVALVAPGSPINHTQLNNAIENVEKLGLKTSFRKDITASDGFLAGSDRRRSTELIEALLNPEIDIIWAVRGGYGCARILKALDQTILQDHAKPIVGYSDITALHAYWLYKDLGICYHAPMLKDPLSAFSFANLQRVLCQNEMNTKLQSNIAFQNQSDVNGWLIGGNLTVFTSLLGSKYVRIPKEWILFIEEIGEASYRIDRMLHQLFLSLDISNLQAVILGKFTDCSASYGVSTSKVLDDFFSKLKIPVFKNQQFGHIEDQVVLPIGISVTIKDYKISWH